MNAYRLFALLVAAAVTSAATGQPASFRGKVVSLVFHIPMEEVNTMSEQATYTSQFRGYDTLEVMTFLVCNDTMRYTSVLASDDSLRLYQVGKTTLLYSDLDEGYLIYPKLSAFHEGVTGKDWRRYRKRHNPLKLNYRLVHPFHRQYVSYANVDDKKVYPAQFAAGGKFMELFHPYGRHVLKGGIFNNTFVVQTFDYYPDPRLDCAAMLDTVDIIRPIEGEIPRHVVAYEPDTLVDFSADEGYFDLGEVYDTTGRLTTVVNFPEAKYTYVELWTAECESCTAQIPYLDSLYQRTFPGGLGFISVYADYADDPTDWLAALPHRSYKWSNYMFPFGRDSYFDRQYNLKLLPRYLIIDETGRIIVRYAPRPSDTRLDNVLEQLYGSK